MASPRKKSAPRPAEAEPIVIDMPLENALYAAISSPEHARTPEVIALTDRALTMRAKGMSEEEIAKAEKVETSTLASWLACPHRGPTVDEMRAMIENDVKPLTVQNIVHLLRAGDKGTTRQMAKDTGMMKPPKSGPTQTKILVGIGQDPVGRDPVRAFVSVEVKHG